MTNRTTQRETVVGVFGDRDSAQRAIEDLKNAGFRGEDIGILMQNRDEAANLAGETGTKAGEAAGIGATTGGLLGALGGLLVGLGALAIPGIGPVLAAGPLVAALGPIVGGTVTGAAIGAGTGALAGALVGLGIPEDEANLYEESFRQGNILVTVRSGVDRFAEAQRILDNDGALDIRGGGAAGSRNVLNNDATATGTYANAPSSATYNQNTSGNTARTAATTSADVNDGEALRVPVVEEQLTANKQARQAGEVTIHKNVVEEQVEVPLELRHEEVTVTQHAVDRPVQAGEQVLQDGQTIRVPIHEEVANVQKQARVTGEVEINKNVVAEQHTVSDTVRREVVDVDSDGNVETRDNGQANYDQTSDRNYNR